MRRRRRAACRIGLLALAVVSFAAPRMPAQEEESPAVLRALDFENAGKYREAAQLFPAAMRT